jgi:hypothetical protein
MRGRLGFGILLPEANGQARHSDNLVFLIDITVEVSFLLSLLLLFRCCRLSPCLPSAGICCCQFFFPSSKTCHLDRSGEPPYFAFAVVLRFRKPNKLL